MAPVGTIPLVRFLSGRRVPTSVVTTRRRVRASIPAHHRDGCPAADLPKAHESPHFMNIPPHRAVEAVELADIGISLVLDQPGLLLQAPEQAVQQGKAPLIPV